MSLQYEATDNVNNAADAREIEINGRIWRKTEESLPQSAQGLRYGLGVERERNLGGHHFIYGRVHGDGVARFALSSLLPTVASAWMWSLVE